MHNKKINLSNIERSPEEENYWFTSDQISRMHQKIISKILDELRRLGRKINGDEINNPDLMIFKDISIIYLKSNTLKILNHEKKPYDIKKDELEQYKYALDLICILRKLHGILE